jgi:hypothetical protein
MRIGEPDLTIPAQDYRPEMGLRNQLNCLSLANEELDFMLEHMGESSAKALRGWDKSIPHNPTDQGSPIQGENLWCVDHPGVIPENMNMVLIAMNWAHDTDPDSFGFYRRNPIAAQLLGLIPEEEVTGWDAFTAGFGEAREYMRRYEALKERDEGGAIHPSLYTRDSRGRFHHQGTGSDSGSVNIFMVWMTKETYRAGQPDDMWAAAIPAEGATVIVEEDALEESEDLKASGVDGQYILHEGPNYFECPVKGCNKRTDFVAEDDGTRNKAKSAMSAHMTAMVRHNRQAEDHAEAKLSIYG